MSVDLYSHKQLEENPAKPADPYCVRQAWLDMVVPAERIGKLEKIPTQRAVTPRQIQQAKTQNYYLTRRSFGGFGSNYDRINWSHNVRCPGGIECGSCGICNPSGSSYCGSCRSPL